MQDKTGSSHTSKFSTCRGPLPAPQGTVQALLPTKHNSQSTQHTTRAPAMSTRARDGSGGGRQFPVGRRRRYAPVVDGAGCGCRPRRPRLLSLPSFLKPCSQLMGGGGGNKAAATTRRSGGGEQYSCASTSTASFSSSSAATHSTGGYAASAYSSDYYYCYPSRAVYGACTAKQQHQVLPPSPLRKQLQVTKVAAPPASPARAPSAAGKNRKNKKKNVKRAAAEEDDGGVGVAVEKESSDPRADFRDSMVQMVVEMGLCDWDGLRGMLRRLLALNAPRHHAAILTAFAEVCTHIASAAAAAAPPLPTQPSPPASYQYDRR